MADVNASIGVNIDASNALSEIKSLQRQISTFHTSIAKSSHAAAMAQQDLQKNFINSINSLGAFTAELRTVKTTAENFTTSLEKNKFSMREYFRYAGASTKTFGRLFSSEFDTINKVAVENVKRLQTQYIKMGRDASGAMKAIAVMPTQLNMKDLATKTQIAAQKQALFNQLVKQGSTNLLNFGKNTQWAGRQLMVGFTLPLITLGTTATKTFMDMEEQAIKFKKVYGDLFTPTAERQQALADITALGQMFTKYGISVSQTVGLAADAAAAGFQGVDLQRQTTEATRLSVLGQIDAQKALETTISLQNAFQLSSADLADTINFLNAVENQTVVSLDDITTAIPKAAPVVKQLGGSVKDLSFFLAAMKEGGINASEGANALKSGLASLVNPTNKARTMLSGFGIDIDKIVNKNAGNVKQTVIDFATALDGLSDLNRTRAIEQLFGKFQLARLSTLFENVTKSGNQASRVLDLSTASTADLAATAEQELGVTANSAMNKFRKSVEDLKFALVPVGEVFLQVVTPFIEKIGGIVDKFNNLSDGTKRIITLITVGIGGLAPIILMTIGLMANFVANGIKGVMLLRNGFLRLTGQSQILGEQTQYLTVEQQNALAAAHSLDQSHAKLIQTFTVEAGVLGALKKAYMDATIAQQNFASRNPMMMMPGALKPKKRAKGKPVTVGGTGNQDSELALLMPGETVIPTKMSKKYARLINGMITDSIPGYRAGRIGSGSEGRIGKSLTTVLRDYKSNVSNQAGLVDFLNINPSDMADITSIYTKQIAKEAGVSIAGVTAEIKQWQTANTAAINAATNAVNAGVPATEAFGPLVEKFNIDMKNAGKAVHKFATTAEKIAPQLQQDLIEAQTAARNLGLNVKNADDATKLAGNLPKNIVAQQMTKPGTFGMLAKARAAGASIFGGRSGISKYGVPRFMLTPGIAPSSAAYLAGSSQEHFSTTQTQAAAQKQMVAARQSLKMAQKSSSPSKVSEGLGGDFGDGYAKGIKKSEKVVKQSAAKLADSAVEAAQKEHVRKTKSLVSVSGVSRERILAAQAQFESMSAEEQNALLASRTGKKRIGPAVPKGTSLLGLTTPLTGREKFVNRVRGMSGVARGLAGGRAGMAASAGLMAASMLPGKIGEVAGQASGLAFGLQAAGMAVKLLPGPLKLAAVAVGGLVVVSKLLSKAKERERLATEGLADSMKTTADQVKTLGDFFGVVPNKLPFDINNAEIVSPQTRTARETLKADPGFQRQFKTTIEQLRKATNNEAKLVFSSLALNLRAQGFAEAQVQTIIDALREEAGKTDVVLDVKSLNLSTESLDKLKNDVAPMITSLNETLSGGAKLKYGQNYVTGEIIKWTELSKDAQKQVNTLSSFMSEAAKSASGMFSMGLIDGKQYEATLTTILGSTNSLNAANRAILMTDMFKKLGVDATDFTSKVKDAATQMKILALVSFGKLGKTASGEENPLLKALGGKNELIALREIKKLYDKVFGTVEKVVKEGQTLQDTTTNGANADVLSAQAKLTIALLQKELDALKTKRDALKEVNDELQRQYEYTQKMQQLQGEITQARISGNYIQAAILGQQQSFTKAQFTRETQSIALDKKITALENRISALQAGARVTAAEQKLLKAKGKGMATGGLVVGAGTGISDSIGAYAGGRLINLSNGEFVMRAKAVNNYGISTMKAINNGSAQLANSSGAVYNEYNMNITGSNADEIANKVIRKLQIVNDKNNKSNAVMI